MQQIKNSVAGFDSIEKKIEAGCGKQRTPGWSTQTLDREAMEQTFRSLQVNYKTSHIGDPSLRKRQWLREGEKKNWRTDVSTSPKFFEEKLQIEEIRWTQIGYIFLKCTLLFCCCNKVLWPKATYGRLFLLTVPEGEPIMTRKARQQVARAGS